MNNVASKGKSHLLLNMQKKQEKETKEATRKQKEEEKDLLIDKLQEEVIELKNRFENDRYNYEEYEKNREILKVLYDSNVIDEDGNLLS